MFENIKMPEVRKTVQDWIANGGNKNAVLIGGIALSFYVRPRQTEDADFLYLKVTDVPEEVQGFRKHRNLAFENKNTGVEVEVLNPQVFPSMPRHIFVKVFETAVTHGTLRVASVEGLVALKLYSSRSKDEADIIAILRKHTLNMSGWKLDLRRLTKLIVLKRRAKLESKEQARLGLD